MPACDRVGSRGIPLTSKMFFFLAPWAEPELLTRLRLLITSVFRLMGRGRPCSLRKRPHALHSTEPSSSRRQSGVVEVVQFWQVGGELLCPPPLVADGEDIENAIPGRLAAPLKALNCGEFEVDAIDARAESPGSCGRLALWCRLEFCDEVDVGLDIGSNAGSECRPPSSAAYVVLKEGRSRPCWWSVGMGNALNGASVEAVFAVGR